MRGGCCRCASSARSAGRCAKPLAGGRSRRRFTAPSRPAPPLSQPAKASPGSAARQNLPRFVLADHHQRPLANVTPWYSWELMMKPVRIVILATMAFLASACAATSAGQPAGSGAPGVSPSGNAGPGQAATRPQSTPAGESSGDNAPSTLLLGHLVMRVPASWRVTYSDAKGDYAVSTGSC